MRFRVAVAIAALVGGASVVRAQDEPPAEGDAPMGLQEAARQGRSIRLGHGTLGGRVPEVYSVVRGDTLWDICDRFFANPWQWPRGVVVQRPDHESPLDLPGGPDSSAECGE